MSSHYAKPENALRKAEDLVKVDKHRSALKTLHNILTSKRRTWQATHEKIMFFYIQLAVDLRRNVKDALVQYRMICQQTNAASLEKVCRHYRQLSEAKCSAAEEEAKKAGLSLTDLGDDATLAAPIDDVIDEEDAVGLGSDESPESILVAAMSGEGIKERTDRQILLPWVKYQWECYRTILDVLRNNLKLEKLYHETARAAFSFCQRFNRNMEFRKLCELMRNHLFVIGKYQGQPNAIDLNSIETQTSYLETRFQQLKVASDLELWQEAYRTIEDIHENMRQSHQEPKPELMKTYYEKLADIFWASGNYLFHAYSLHKFYSLSIQTVDQSTAAAAASTTTPSTTTDPSSSPLSTSTTAPTEGKFDSDAKRRLASAVILASLTVSGSQEDAEHFRHEGNTRLAQLLGFKKETPTRARLLLLLQQQHIFEVAGTEATQLHSLMEHSFSPLLLWKQISPLLEILQKDEKLLRYIEPLHHLVVIRVLQQLSSVYKTMKLDHFFSLVPSQISAHTIERIIMQAISAEQLSLRIDHRNQLILFPDEDLEGARFSSQLVWLSKELSAIADKLTPVLEPDLEVKAAETRSNVFGLIRNGIEEEHEDVFIRQSEIEKRKQESERAAIEKEKRENEAKEKAAAERKAEEAKRLAEESKKREAERIKKEQEQRDRAAKQQLAEAVSKKIETVATKVTSSGKGAAAAQLKKIESMTADLERLDRVALLAAQEALLESQRKETERRRRETYRRIDYTTRASRIEEREALAAAHEKQKVEEAEQLEQDFAKYCEADLKNHEKALAEKKRLSRMGAEKDKFFEQVLKRREVVLAAERKKQMERFRKREQEYLKEQRRKQAEEEEKERQKRAFAEAEAARLAVEAAKKAAAEEARKKREEERLAAEEERKKKLAYEAELEAKDAARRAEREKEKVAAAATTTVAGGPAAGPSAAGAAGAPGGAGGDRWRRGGGGGAEREREREPRGEFRGGERDYRDRERDREPRGGDRERGERDWASRRGEAPKEERDWNRRAEAPAAAEGGSRGGDDFRRRGGEERDWTRRTEPSSENAPAAAAAAGAGGAGGREEEPRRREERDWKRRDESNAEPERRWRTNESEGGAAGGGGGRWQSDRGERGDRDRDLARRPEPRGDRPEPRGERPEPRGERPDFRRRDDASASAGAGAADRPAERDFRDRDRPAEREFRRRDENAPSEAGAGAGGDRPRWQASRDRDTSFANRDRGDRSDRGGDRDRPEAPRERVDRDRDFRSDRGGDRPFRSEREGGAGGEGGRWRGANRGGAEGGNREWRHDRPGGDREIQRRSEEPSAEHHNTNEQSESSSSASAPAEDDGFVQVKKGGRR